MWVLQDILYSYPLLSLLNLALMGWALVDAYQRGVQGGWWYIILFVPLVGALAYFIAERRWNFGVAFPTHWFERKTPLAELQYRAEQTPTLANHLALAERLVALKRFNEAIPQLERAQKLEPTHAPTCYELAQCRLATGAAAESETLLQKIVAREPRWNDYAAWRLLIETQERLERPADAVDTARQLVKQSPRIQHKVILARLLIDTDADGEARLLLENAVQEQQFANRATRRLNRPWVKEANRLLRELGH